MNNFLKHPLLGCIVLFLSFSSYSQQQLYVAKDGDDANPGTLESPFLTISKAASEAVAGTTVFIREGTYEETLTPANSGSPGNPIIFQPFGDERVIISAMESLSGWTNESAAIYYTDIDWDLGQQNFVMNDQTAMDLARWPNNVDGSPFTLNARRNEGGSTSDQATFNSRAGFLTSNEIPSDVDWTGGSLFFYGDKSGAGWLAWKEFITSSASGRVDFDITKSSGTPWIYQVHAPADGGEFYLEGVKGALDFQNEWWFDTTAKRLFVQIPGGGAPADEVVKMRKRLLTIDLSDKSYIEIRNLAVFGGSIEVTGTASNNTIFGVSSFYGNHTQGIFTSFNSGLSSIRVEGLNNTVERCEVAFSACTGIRMGGENNILKNSYIHDFDFLGSYDAPLVARGGKNNKIINNTIFNGGRDGINYNGENCEIAFNDLSKSNLIADDCALFYTVGDQPNTSIHNNWFHDTQSREGKNKAAGIYMDVNPSGIKVFKNVIWNTEWNAIQINADISRQDVKDIDIFNNTMYNNARAMGAFKPNNAVFEDIRVWNNLAEDSGNDTFEPDADQQNNLFVSEEAYRDVKTGDFTLAVGSEPIDKGIVIEFTENGINYNITEGFMGANPDVGAYEFGGDNWVAGIDWNPLLGPTGLGCYGLPGERCSLTADDDEDQDGVANEDDICPNTPEGDTVDVQGCTIFTLPADNFAVLSSGEGCIGSANASISITAKEPFDYIAKLQGTDISTPFTENIQFNNLPAETYTVCITIGSISSFEQCFTITLDSPEKLSVLANVSAQQKEVLLNLEGGELYRIELNDKVYMTDKDNITLELTNGKNELLVKTNKDCQGKFKKTISIQDGIYIHPNPFNDKINIALPPATFAGDVSWELYSFRGKLIYNSSQTRSVNSNANSIAIDMSAVATGSYIIKIKTPSSIVHKQVIKK